MTFFKFVVLFNHLLNPSLFIAEEILVKLSKVIEYIHQRPQQMNADVTLSLTIVQGKTTI